MHLPNLVQIGIYTVFLDSVLGFKGYDIVLLVRMSLRLGRGLKPISGFVLKI